MRPRRNRPRVVVEAMTSSEATKAAHARRRRELELGDTILGFDYSTFAIHVVILEADESAPPQAVSVALEGADAFERTRFVRSAMAELELAIPWRRTVAVGIESPQGIAKSVVAMLAAIQGAMLSTMPADALVVPFYPVSWRKACGIPGNAKKPAVLAWANANGAPAPELKKYAQDTADAYCIARAMQAELAKQTG